MSAEHGTASGEPAYPDDSWMKIPLLPGVGKFGAKIDATHPPYPWFFAFQQVKILPERL
jgi:hypothetical protein